MMRRLARVHGLIALGLLAAAPAAAQRGSWQSAQCDISTGHYLLNSAVLYLRNATETRFPDQRERDLRDAQRVLHQAIDQGRGEDGAVWYLLGRYYVLRSDLAGADSAFTRAERLAPDCRADIAVYRRRLWVPVFNRGVDALQNSDDAAAREAFLEANRIFGTVPPAMYYLGQIAATAGQPDTAIAYYRRAIALAGDSANAEDEQYQSIKRTSTFNVARLFHREEQYDSAAAWYRAYRALDPNDTQALTGLAEVLAVGGNEAEALALYDTVLARADSLPALDIFATGVALFRANRFERAAQAFEMGLARSPFYRDALFNLANTYLSMADDSATAAERRELGERMEPILRRLIETDPANQASQRLLAASYQLRGLSDSTLAILERVQAAPFDVTVSMFQPVGGGAWELRGLITNAGDAAVQVPAITFEFLNEAGEVVHTEVVPAQSLEAVAPIQFRVQGETIAAWRYRVG